MLWIARDKDGSLYLYNYKPKRLKDNFGLDIINSWNRIDDCSSIELDADMFKSVTWDNSPKECFIKIKEEEK